VLAEDLSLVRYQRSRDFGSANVYSDGMHLIPSLRLKTLARN
jgi:hypothetical protein